MATPSAVFVPDQAGGVSASLAPATASAAILLGPRRIFRIWSDAGPMFIKFGTVAVAAPTAADYAIGEVPQEFDTGSEFQYIRLFNGSIGLQYYHIQTLNKF
jgi:hypothetical protein